MALKPSHSHKPKLTREQVLEMRNRYYRDGSSIRRLSQDFRVSEGTVVNAVKGNGAYYSSIEDGISDLDKENRMPYNQKYSITRAKQSTIRVHTRRTRGKYRKKGE